MEKEWGLEQQNWLKSAVEVSILGFSVVFLAIGCSSNGIIGGGSSASRSFERTLPAEVKKLETVITVHPAPEGGEPIVIEQSGGKLVIPSNARVEVKATSSLSTEEAIERHMEVADSVGPSLEGKEGVDEFESTAPAISLSPSAVLIGAAGVKLKALSVSLSSKGFTVLYVMGGLLVVGGAFCLFMLKQIGAGVGLAAAGVALIGTARLFERYPWVLLIAAGVGLLLLVWFAVSKWKGSRRDKALLATVRGIQLAPDNKAVKSMVASEAGKDYKAVDAVIHKMKVKEGLKSFTPEPRWTANSGKTE